MGECPDDNALLAWLEGTLSDERAAQLAAHFDQCALCESLVNAYCAEDDRRPAHSVSDCRPGALIGGRYRLERRLGEGGMGVVWSATHVHTRRPAALKFLRESRRRLPGAERRFLREALAATAVVHPHVLPIHDTIELPDGSPVLVMDLLRGESLRERLLRKPLSLWESARIMVPVVSAVSAAHAAGVVHRDLKPDNIFLVASGRGGRGPDGVDVKVLDFGLAKLTGSAAGFVESGELSITGELLGTPHYMAPEQAFGEAIDARADVWALGVIAYECLSSERPFTGNNVGQVLRQIATATPIPLSALVPKTPPEIESLVMRMLARDPARRPDLREVAEAFSLAARDAETQGQVRSKGRLRRAANVVLWLSGVAAVFLWLWLSHQRSVARPAQSQSPSAASQSCEEQRCDPVKEALDGLRLELPCIKDIPTKQNVCRTGAPRTQTVKIGGSLGTTYDVTLRLRGVVETKGYNGGSNEGGHWQEGGTPIDDPWNTYSLAISSPAQSFYLNAGESKLLRCFPVDVQKRVRVAAGATVTLGADPIDADREMIKNVGEAGAPIVIPGIAPAPAAYNGQFLQLDVVNVAIAGP